MAAGEDVRFATKTTVRDIIGSIKSQRGGMMDIGHALKVEGWMSPEELTWLAEQAASVPPGGAIVEIGSYKGRSACALAANTQAQVYCIDTFGEFGTPSWTLDEFRKNTEPFPNVIAVIRNSAHAARTITAAGLRFNFAFIDASHDAFNVRQDIMIWRRLLKDGGVLAGHDYGDKNWPDVTTVVDELIPKFKVVGSIWIADNTVQE